MYGMENGSWCWKKFLIRCYARNVLLYGLETGTLRKRGEDWKHPKCEFGEDGKCEKY